MEYVASTDEGLVTQLANLSAKAPTVQSALGLTAADLSAIAADYNALQAAVVDVASKQTAAQSSTQAKNASRAAIVKRLRALVKRIKSNANYTPSIGEQLGIVAPASGAAAGPRALASEVVQPKLKAAVSGEGAVTIRFVKNKYTGVMIYCRRTGESDFGLLAKQLVSPLTDRRTTLTAGLPETREYRACYISNDAVVGQMSDIAVVTVPAGAAAATMAISLKAAA